MRLEGELQTVYQMVVGNRRLLTIDVSGAPDGAPVFLLHGTPGSRNGPKPRSSVLYRLGVRLICYDRPGYGGSSRVPDRRVADAARDVEMIADKLKLGRFAVVGRSGGGPHALACSALLSDRSAAPPSSSGSPRPTRPDCTGSTACGRTSVSTRPPARTPPR